jgi:hypothetical protein
MAIRRRGVISELGQALFGPGETATGHEAFDREYRVSADIPSAARTYLRPELIAAHLAVRLPDWSLDRDELLTYRDGRIDEPLRVPAEARMALRVAALLDAPARGSTVRPLS